MTKPKVLFVAGWFDFKCLDYQIKLGAVLSSQRFSASEKTEFRAEGIQIFVFFSQEILRIHVTTKLTCPAALNPHRQAAASRHHNINLTRRRT